MAVHLLQWCSDRFREPQSRGTPVFAGLRSLCAILIAWLVVVPMVVLDGKAVAMPDANENTIAITTVFDN